MWNLKHVFSSEKKRLNSAQQQRALTIITMATLASSHFLSPVVATSSFHRRHLCQRFRKRKRAPTTNKKSSNRPIPIPLSALSIEEEKQDVSHFINLKNGIEALPVLREHFPKSQIHFMRMQSTLCERGDMEKIMLEVDANLLLKLATDRPCVIYDLSLIHI